ncbi:hypothetical protein EDC96DRAFT_445862 [Choanephora cucurbitarum]|nr:hypothetical protein EDC96DRAFT_445862 [Choanephora cucurbitarum]
MKPRALFRLHYLLDIFDRALASKPILSSIEDLVTVLLAKCDHARRRIDWEDLDEDAVMDLKVAFEESLEYIAEGRTNERFDDAEKARELWEDVVERQGLNTEAWIQLILFERDQENYERCATLFKQAIQKKIDNPARLIDVWNTIEHEVGTLASFEESLVRINRKTKQLSRQWQSQYTQEKEEKSKEKKIMDRKKKSQHRIAQKQRAKEKKNQTDDESTKEDISAEVAPKEPNPLKRKLSAENEQEAKKVKSGPKEEQEEVKQDKPKSTAAFMPRPRSARPHTAIRRGKALKLGQRSVNRSDADKLMTESDKKEEPETSKSNDDFRAMLLGKK